MVTITAEKKEKGSIKRNQDQSEVIRKKRIAR
jgi:hypothetical protein